MTAVDKRAPLQGRALLSGTGTAKLLLIAIFVSLVFLPTLRMLFSMDAQTIRAVTSSPGFLPSVKNSLVAAVTSTAITVLLALLLAFFMQRVSLRGKTVFEVLIVLPMLIPSISSGIGLVILMGNNGILTKLLHWGHTIYGLKGIVLGSIIYALPASYLMLSDVIRYEDASPYEAAQVLGIPKLRQFFSITLPYLRKPILLAVFSAFTLIITDYGIPLIVGGKYTTIPVVMYQEVIGQLNFEKGAVYSTLLLIPAIAAFLLDMVNKEQGNAAFVIKPHPLNNSRPAKISAYICCGAVAFVALLPILCFVLLAFSADYPYDFRFTFAHVERAFLLRAGKYLLNSVIIAFSVSFIGIVIAFLTAYLSARAQSPASGFLHLSAMTSAAIPGIVLGLSYVLTFRTSAIYGTILILILVNLIHFIASPYLMMYNSLSKINRNLEAVAQTLRISRFHIIKDVLLPQCKGTLLKMFSYFFVNCMITISAVSFLATTANKPISLMINQFEAQMQLECAAVVSLLILAVNLLIKLTMHLISKSWAKKRG